MITILNLTDDALCVPERFMGKLKSGKGKTYKVLHDTMGVIGKAVVTMIWVEDGDKTYLADKQTGSCYDTETLLCMTGPLRLMP